MCSSDLHTHYTHTHTHTLHTHSLHTLHTCTPSTHTNTPHTHTLSSIHSVYSGHTQGHEGLFCSRTLLFCCVMFCSVMLCSSLLPDGDREEGGDSPDLRRTESDSLLKKVVSNHRKSCCFGARVCVHRCECVSCACVPAWGGM